MRGSERVIGGLLNSLDSNNKSAARIDNAAETLDLVARKYGVDASDSAQLQILFANELDRMFKPAAATSLQGRIGQEIARGAEETANQTVAGMALRGAGKGVDFIRGVNEEGAFKAIEKLLKEGKK